MASSSPGRGETYAGEAARAPKDRIIGALATVYAAAMLLAGGAKFLLLSALLYAPGTLAVMPRRGASRARPLFSVRERLLFGVLCVAALAALVALVIGALSI